jgi:hypothetical protein
MSAATTATASIPIRSCRTYPAAATTAAAAYQDDKSVFQASRLCPCAVRLKYANDIVVLMTYFHTLFN